MTNEEKYKTAKERGDAFLKFCNSHSCGDCAIHKMNEPKDPCAFIWLALEAEEKPLPCPFCGGETEVDSAIHYGSYYYFVQCKICHMSSISCLMKDEAIAAWNRRVK